MDLEFCLEESMAELNLAKINETESEKVAAETETSKVPPIEDLSSRSLRKRSNSESSLHGIRNRKIQKPKKLTAIELKTEKDVLNFYKNINKKKTLKPVLLETIYEQDESEDEAETELIEESTSAKKSKETGRKAKRVIQICDGLNITKALKEKRKNLAKKHLGNKKRPKKIALSKFMEYFKEKTAESPQV
jgi:hypothetical protein